MRTQQLATAELVRLFDSGSLSGLSEWELLEQFVAHRDELAFQVLVSRHGPMVLGICRRMLANTADVEDAFQATFQVLLRRAGSLGPGDAIAAWLHGVAVRVAQQSRGAAARRGQRERLGMAVEVAGAEPSGADPELRQILDEEINRLPLKYRSPIVLCYLEGQTHEEAARQLHWPLGTVKGRLARARSLLESRLTRRGVACGTGLAALAACSSTEAAVPASLLASTCNAAARVGSGTLLAHVVSTSIAQLIQGVLSTMILQKMKLMAVAFVVSGLFLTGAGVVARQQATGSKEVVGPDDPKIQTEPTGPSKPAEAPLRKSDSRLSSGTEPTGPSKPAEALYQALVEKQSPPLPRAERNLHQELIQAARLAFLAAKEEHAHGRGSLDRVHSRSRLLMEAERDSAASPTAKFDAVEGHFQRMKEMARAENESGKTGDAGAAEAQAFLIQAELEVAKANAWQPTAWQSAATGPPARTGKSDEPGKDPKSLAILAKLEEPIAMSFAAETPLDDVLKYIKQATTGPNGPGIPIYVDPLGLQEAEKTLTSTIMIDLEGVPLRRTLQLLLKQLGLGYFVDDGILVITSDSAEDMALPPSQMGPSPFLRKQEKLERGEMTIQEMKGFAEDLKVKTEIMKQLHELNKLDEGTSGGMGGGQAVKTDDTASLLKEMKALLEQIKAEREKGKKDGSK